MGWTLPRLDGRKVLGGALVAVLHVVLIAMLLRLSNQPVSAPMPMREIILQFFTPKAVVPEKRKEVEAAPRKDKRKVPDALTPVAVPDYRSDIPALQSFGHMLVDCAPENLSTLSTEDRARCAHSSLAQKPDDTKLDFKDHTDRSTSAALWARRRAIKNGPMLLPCANPQNPLPSLATVLCLAKSAINGKFDMDALPSYADKPEELHLPNGGDPPDKPGGTP